MDADHEIYRTAIEAATELHVPALCDLEMMSALRKLLRQRLASIDRARELLQDYAALPLDRHGHEPLLPRIFELRDNFTAYDASYVVLAERLGAPLLTGDAHLTSAIRAARGPKVTLAVQRT